MLVTCANITAVTGQETGCEGVFTTAVVQTMSGTLMATISLSSIELQSVDASMDFSGR